MDGETIDDLYEAMQRIMDARSPATRMSVFDAATVLIQALLAVGTWIDLGYFAFDLDLPSAGSRALHGRLLTAAVSGMIEGSVCGTGTIGGELSRVSAIGDLAEVESSVNDETSGAEFSSLLVLVFTALQGVTHEDNGIAVDRELTRISLDELVGKASA